MTLALREAEFRTSDTRVVHSHSQLPGTLDDESLIVPYLAIQSSPKKIILTEVIVAFYFFLTTFLLILFPLIILQHMLS
jgi:hypothetical protein